ncbi:GNAT family N-acetyltransferase [Aquincola tertiaricarbonis]|uniref:GNAT family N-acetyltransferase n=1 Tax=Aquincola tertiaricarbonis TaxID=391953 RepID=UPI00287344E7|nr:GNAT family N-acetyltransferase [Aquincola tertiaricarbonis]
MVRAAAMADLPALAALFDGYRQFYEQAPNLGAATRFMQQRLQRGDAVLLVAEHAAGRGPLIGFCQLYLSFCSIAAQPIQILSDLFVAPGARRAGAGRALLQAAHAQAAELGVARLELTTARSNHRAQALYASLGWVLDEVYLAYSRQVAD